MASSTATKTATTTTTATALKQLQVLTAKVSQEAIQAISASNVSCTFTREGLTKAVSAFFLHDVVSSIGIAYVHEGVTLCEYRYALFFDRTGVKEYGTEVPVSQMPPGTVAVAVAYPNTNQPKEYRDAIFAEYGWKDGSPRSDATDMQSIEYGTFASDDGSFGISRTRRISRRLAQTATPKELR